MQTGMRAVGENTEAHRHISEEGLPQLHEISREDAANVVRAVLENCADCIGEIQRSAEFSGRNIAVVLLDLCQAAEIESGREHMTPENIQQCIDGTIPLPEAVGMLSHAAHCGDCYNAVVGAAIAADEVAGVVEETRECQFERFFRGKIDS